MVPTKGWRAPPSPLAITCEDEEMAGETKTRAAFRTGRTPAESLANAIGPPGERTITQRLVGIDQRLEGMERVLFALARAQGIDPDALG